MVSLIRVDDRLLHGQIICAWVPYVKADCLVVASDEAAKDRFVSDIIESCACKGLSVRVKRVEESADYFMAESAPAERAILIVGDLRDAMRIYMKGMKFSSLNIGNLHHEDGRRITPSVTVNGEDEEILRQFSDAGVKLDIRDVPASNPAEYRVKG